WNQHLEHALPGVVKGDHLAAVPYTDVPALLARVRQRGGVPAKALEFIILTAARLGEAQMATWSEFDLDNRVWTIPGSRMKAGKEHRVPLSPAAIAVLKDMAAIRRSDYVFPGERGGVVSRSLPWRLLKQLAGKKKVTVHGFRSSFRDWAAERTNFPREIAEAALAHSIPSAVEAAYRRTGFFGRPPQRIEARAGPSTKPGARGRVAAVPRASSG